MRLGMARAALKWARIGSADEYRRATHSQLAQLGDHGPLLRRLIRRGRPDSWRPCSTRRIGTWSACSRTRTTAYWSSRGTIRPLRGQRPSSRFHHADLPVSRFGVSGDDW